MLVRKDQNWQAAWFAKIHKAGDSCMTGYEYCVASRLVTMSWTRHLAPGHPLHLITAYCHGAGAETLFTSTALTGDTQLSRHRVTLFHTIMHAIELPAPVKKQKRSVFSHFGSVYIPCLKSNNCHTCPKMSKWVYNSIHTVFWRFCCLTSLIMYLKNTPYISLRPQYRPAYCLLMPQML